jgi:hypothetical protein
MSLASNLIKWTPKILEASSRDIARFGPQAARVRALLNFIPTMSDDAAKIGRNSWYAARDAANDAAGLTVWGASRDATRNATADTARGAARGASRDAAMSEAADAIYDAHRIMALDPAFDAASTEAVSDLITPEVYRTVTNPMASARALDRLAGRAPESFIPIARNMGERGLVSAPADIVTALRVSKLPQQQQSLVMGLVDSGMTIEDAMLAMRALS